MALERVKVEGENLGDDAEDEFSLLFLGEVNDSARIGAGELVPKFLSELLTR